MPMYTHYHTFFLKNEKVRRRIKRRKNKEEIYKKEEFSLLQEQLLGMVNGGYRAFVVAERREEGGERRE